MSRKKTFKVAKNASIALITIIAWLSGYFVMQIVYDSIAASIVFGTLWAVIVLCQSRFSYISLKSDGRIEITKEELKSNTWHIISAILTAVLVSIPILLKVFEPTIIEAADESAHNLGLQIQTLAELFATQWFLIVPIVCAIILVYLTPIFVKMASEERK